MNETTRDFPITAQENHPYQMSLSGLTQQMEFNCQVNEGKGDNFDLSDLPDEMIDRVFSFLDVEDRMRMRLNKRLNKIESTSKYYLRRVDLYEDPLFTTYNSKYVIIKLRKYPLDFLLRIAQNTSIGDLQVELDSSMDVNRKLIDLVKKIKNILYLNLVVGDTSLLTWTMRNSLSLDLTGRCTKLYLNCQGAFIYENFSSDSLYQVYKSMNDRSTRLRELSINARFNEEQVNGFLNLLGITCRSGRIISNRNIEVYKDNAIEVEREPPMNFYVNIFDGLFHISFYCGLIGSSSPYSQFNIELHENLDSLNTSCLLAKSRGMKVDVYSE